MESVDVNINMKFKDLFVSLKQIIQRFRSKDSGGKDLTARLQRNQASGDDFKAYASRC